MVESLTSVILMLCVQNSFVLPCYGEDEPVGPIERAASAITGLYSDIRVHLVSVLGEKVVDTPIQFIQMLCTSLRENGAVSLNTATATVSKMLRTVGINVELPVISQDEIGRVFQWTTFSVMIFWQWEKITKVIGWLKEKANEMMNVVIGIIDSLTKAEEKLK